MFNFSMVACSSVELYTILHYGTVVVLYINHIQLINCWFCSNTNLFWKSAGGINAMCRHQITCMSTCLYLLIITFGALVHRTFTSINIHMHGEVSMFLHVSKATGKECGLSVYFFVAANILNLYFFFPCNGRSYYINYQLDCLYIY